MAEAYIVDAVRAPVGRRGGGLAHVHPADLGAHSLKALMDRTGVDPGAVEDVIFGCVDTIGPQAGDIARTAWLAAGLPEEVPGTTIDRQCGSSQQAVHFAAQAVMSGTTDLVVAGGSCRAGRTRARSSPPRSRPPGAYRWSRRGVAALPDRVPSATPSVRLPRGGVAAQAGPSSLGERSPSASHRSPSAARSH